MKSLTFTIRNMAFFVVLVAVGLAWWVDRTTLRSENQSLELERNRNRLHNLLAHSNMGTRHEALTELQHLATSDSIPALFYAMTDPSLEICLDARSTLEKLTGKSFRDDIQDPTRKSLDAELKKWESWYEKQPDGAAYIPFPRESTDAELASAEE